MPKIVDHDAQRAMLVERAIPMFRRLGYHGLSMRQIARELEVSKSSLYHYFPSKEALFEACSRQVTAPELPELAEDATPEERFEVLLQFLNLLDDDFRGELSLMLDYTRGKSDAQVREDPLMREALTGFLLAMKGIVGEKSAERALQRSHGILVLRAFGLEVSFNDLRELCERPS
jgi:AcrR family transcriptional regulator